MKPFHLCVAARACRSVVDSHHLGSGVESHVSALKSQRIDRRKICKISRDEWKFSLISSSISSIHSFAALRCQTVFIAVICISHSCFLRKPQQCWLQSHTVTSYKRDLVKTHTRKLQKARSRLKSTPKMPNSQSHFSERSKRTRLSVQNTDVCQGFGLRPEGSFACNMKSEYSKG